MTQRSLYAAIFALCLGWAAPPRMAAQGAITSDASTEYRIGEGDDRVRIFFLKQVKTPQELQEIATVVRSVAEIRTLLTYNQRNAITVRGTAAQLALADWLIRALDRAPNP